MLRLFKISIFSQLKVQKIFWKEDRDWKLTLDWLIRSNNVFLASKKWIQWLKKIISSSTSCLSHLSQLLSFKGVIGLVYLPDSIFNLWELILNLVMHLLFLGSFIKSRYISKPKFVLIWTYVLNFPFSFIS